MVHNINIKTASSGTYQQHHNIKTATLDYYPEGEIDLIKMDAVQNLPPHKQQEFMVHLEQMQLKDSLT